MPAGERRGQRRLDRALRVLIAIVAFAIPGASAGQSEITFTSATASWFNAQDNQPGSTANDPVITNGVPTSSVNWGVTSGEQSGYDVTITIPDPNSFPVASFAHRNFSVSSPLLTSVQLEFDIDFEIDGVQTGPLDFTFTFTHEETPNNLDPCPYPTPPGEGCTDRVTFLDAPDPTIFVVEGKTYTLGLSFLDETGDPVSEFLTSEGGVVNEAGLDVSFALVPPQLEVSKIGPASMAIGQPGEFRIDVHNTGPNDAWNATIVDALPGGASGGMCNLAPQILSAQVFEADGVTPAAGKGPLVEGTDFTLSFDAAPDCSLSLAMASPISVIGADQRLVVVYETQLDGGTPGGASLTNVAAAIEWFDDAASNANRSSYTRSLSDGTVGIVDHEDAHTVTTGPSDYLFEKTVVDPSSGAPVTVAAPGDTLRYQLRLQNRLSVPLAELEFSDELDRLNAIPAFEPGSLSIVTLPAGADASGTDPNGGAAGTGLLDVRDLRVEAGGVALVEFDVTLAPVLANGRDVLNQSTLAARGFVFALSDDPGPNGPADPLVSGDEDPTRVVIASAPAFRIEKTSSDLTDDPAVLLAGETLRYTIRVQNVGSDDARGVELRDAVPTNTRYVPGSTRLNGAPVDDGSAGLSPLVGGLLISSPDDPTPGLLLAGGTAPGRVATIEFDVQIDADVPDGTLVSNQAFVSSPEGGLIDQPSDDPDTSLIDDPTRDVVGNAPLLFAPKTVELLVDAPPLGQVDPGDVLRYTIAVHNDGAAAATAVVLQDAVPANTRYEPGSTTLNGSPVPDAAGGASPLLAGLSVQSADVSSPGTGTVNIGEQARVSFDLQVEAGTPAGTVIRNQAVVASAELPNQLTDGDGNPATGPEPTIVIVGDGQQLAISKSVSVVGGGPVLAGGRLDYAVRITNIGTVDARDILIVDDLALASSGALSLVPGSIRLDGSTEGVAVAGSLVAADWSATRGALAPGDSITLRLEAEIAALLGAGAPVVNSAEVTWNAGTQSAVARVSVEVGGVPGQGAINGSVWHDRDFDDLPGAAERRLEGWIVELERDGLVVQSTTTDGQGDYRLAGIAPNEASGEAYALQFRAPDAGASTASLGQTVSPFIDGPQRISALVVSSGSNLQGLNLPIDPNGVVYDSILRIPIAGARLQMRSASSGAPLSSGCFADPAQQDQVTGALGFYKFDLNFSDATCPSGADYLIEVIPPGGGFAGGASTVIPPITDETTTAFSVPACLGGSDDAITTTPQHCEVQRSETLPPASVAPRSSETDYYLHLRLDESLLPGSSQLFNNHVPVDAELAGAVAIRKTTPAIDVSRGQLVPYEIVITNTLPVPLDALEVIDRYPAGFRYVEGSARIDGVPSEPGQSGRELVWSIASLEPSATRTVALLLAVGAGVTEGEFVNRAFVQGTAIDGALSGEATATVRVTPDPTFDCTDVVGKVFDDRDRDGHQDEGEPGLPDVRLVTLRGLAVRTDPHGRFHITCAIVPDERRGSNFVLKLDDRTLPSGYRMTTRQTQVARATRGKTLSLGFGAAIARVVGLDLADEVFEPGTSEMRRHWKTRLPILLDELAKAESILRLSYLADIEDEALVRARLKAVERMIRDAWAERSGEGLEVETEVFRRDRGGASAWPGPGTGGSEESRRSEPEPSVEPDRSPRRTGPLPSVSAGPPALLSSLVPDAGQAGERQLPAEPTPVLWATDPARVEADHSDQLEARRVSEQAVEVRKLTDVVPPIRFASGAAAISPDVVEALRDRLSEMQHLQNVRLHLVGHADDRPLSPALRSVYGDNEGLSRERAGEMAELLQSALSLPAESISFGWAGAAMPIASNETEAGRALNRRVEVEIWYDEPTAIESMEEVLVTRDVKRVKVCRTETVCKLRYRLGHERRARLRNLIPPLADRDDRVVLPQRFLAQVQQTLADLSDRQGVVVRVLAHTDDLPLEGREQRIYGTHLALSKARARRVALQLMDALALPASAVQSDGLGSAQPVASNATARGRGLNRRIEVEFWYDDALLDLPDEPQVCPGDAETERVTRVHEPSEGRLSPLPIEEGEPVVPGDFGDRLLRALGEVADRDHPRLRFVGYTRNEGLGRRVAEVYGDDIGLSAARARRTMERLQAQLGLSDAQVEHEGRGFVHADDVVNAGFLQGDSDHVVVQVVYDEQAVVDDRDGIEVIPLTRELTPQAPLSLNPMRITVDGVPIDDPQRSSSDIQRCTDVALEAADIAFRFDDLEGERRLSVSSTPPASQGAPVRFRMYNNYPFFIERAEIRIFERGESVRAEPLAVIETDRRGFAEWTPTASRTSMDSLAFVLRVYGEDGSWDETAPQSLWRVGEDQRGPRLPENESFGSADQALLAGYGESDRFARNIPIDTASTVRVSGEGIPAGHSVWLAGTELPTDDEGRFVGEVLLPQGLHTVEVAVLDEQGNGELFLRDLSVDRNDWFFVGLADLTLSADLSGSRPNELEGNNATDDDSFANGRLAFFTQGRWGEDWRLTASADTREGPVEDLFTNFLDKSPQALFRRLDPDYHMPTFGDDGSIDQMAPTLGKFYVKLEKGDDHLLWGNFTVRYDDNELALVERGLYGGNLLTRASETTSFGERRYLFDAFVADPGTVPSREEFRGTGGSVYFLNRRDLLIGSERLRVEVRDKATGLVRSVVRLQPELDYDIDYIQGRVLLTDPLSAVASDDLLVRNDGLSGDEVWLVVQYEYTPGFDEVDVLSSGARAHYWVGDFLKLGMTANRNDDSGNDSSLYAADVTLRHSTHSWLKLQASRSEGRVSTSLQSSDGGFDFSPTLDSALAVDDAYAYRADVSVEFAEWMKAVRGRLTLYGQRLEAGYSAPGLNTVTDTDQLGGTLTLPLGESAEIRAKADHTEQDQGLETTTVEVDASLEIARDWELRAGVRHDERQDEAPAPVSTQEEGDRTDVVVQVEYEPSARMRSYAFGQGTVRSTGDREENHRGGVGGRYRLNDRLALEGEVSHGDLGPAAQIGSDYQHSERTQLYMNYALDNERGYDGLNERRGTLTTGAKSRLSDSASVYAENQYQHATVTGLTRAVGIDYVPFENWTIGVNWESGETRDRETAAETRRRAGGFRAGYGTKALSISSGVEYVYNDTESADGSRSHRSTWLFRNNLKYQMNEDGRLIAKFNHAISDSSDGDFFDGGFTEAVLGYAYRPVSHDRLFSLVKYTYFYNVPTADQTGQDGSAAQFPQKSHVFSADVSYDLSDAWRVGAKYAYRLSQVSLDREDPDYFDNDAHLGILRVDWRFQNLWEATLEGRLLELPDVDERRAGALVALYRYFGDHLKAGLGYNFTDFSEDLTDLSYDHHGLFFNVVGSF